MIINAIVYILKFFTLATNNFLSTQYLGTMLWSQFSWKTIFWFLKMFNLKDQFFRRFSFQTITLTPRLKYACNFVGSHSQNSFDKSQSLVESVTFDKRLKSLIESRTFDKRVTFDESLFMSIWARLGRFLEIYSPKFWDFQQKRDFGWKTKKTFVESHTVDERVTLDERLKRLSSKVTLSTKEWLSLKVFRLWDRALLIGFFQRQMRARSSVGSNWPRNKKFLQLRNPFAAINSWKYLRTLITPYRYV
jgi:hypothetical protein